MPKETTRYDQLAKELYDLRANERDNWPHFFHLKRKERDYWRALAQVAEEEGTWTLGKRQHK